MKVAMKNAVLAVCLLGSVSMTYASDLTTSPDAVQPQTSTQPEGTDNAQTNTTAPTAPEQNSNPVTNPNANGSVENNSPMPNDAQPQP